MNLLDGLEITPLHDDEKSEREAYLNSYATCPNCRCRRKLKNLKSYIETESWEMPWIRYAVYICPKCGTDMEEQF